VQDNRAGRGVDPAKPAQPHVQRRTRNRRILQAHRDGLRAQHYFGLRLRRGLPGVPPRQQRHKGPNLQDRVRCCHAALGWTMDYGSYRPSSIVRPHPLRNCNTSTAASIRPPPSTCSILIVSLSTRADRPTVTVGSIVLTIEAREGPIMLRPAKNVLMASTVE